MAVCSISVGVAVAVQAVVVVQARTYEVGNGEQSSNEVEAIDLY
jgi:hypothetical protein